MPDRRLIGRAELARRLGLGTTARTFERHRARLMAGDPPLPDPVPGEPRPVWDSAAIDAYIARRSGYALETEAADREAFDMERHRQELRQRLPLLLTRMA